MRWSGPVVALGAMSGTSLDGVDAAILETDGERILGFGPSAYRPYPEPDRAVIAAALGRWPSEPGVQAAAEAVETAHALALAELAGQAQLAGIHGQTLAHEPGGRGTHQAGDGAVLAAALGLPVVWDFRSADIRLGGQGAPLAPFYHFACARWIGARDPLVFLNLGGVGNLTWVDPGAPVPHAPGALLAFDTGPANAPLDDLMRARRGLPFDADGALAAGGEADADVLAGFADDPFFALPPPKSLDREDFAGLLARVAGLGDADAAATLAACAAAGVVRGLEHCPAPPRRVLVSGGGRRNATLMAMIAAGSGLPVEPVEAEGLDGDMLEAQAFAFLAVRVAKGLPTSAPGTTGVRAAISGGTLSWPATRRAG